MADDLRRPGDPDRDLRRERRQVDRPVRDDGKRSVLGDMVDVVYYEAIADRIRASGARVVLVGLGCPRQEIFVYAMRPLLDMPLLAVGAAFDYHAGQLRHPPAWMQRRGLEWLWRLGLEPARLWKRYLLLNPAYLAALGAQKTRLWKAAPPSAASTRPESFAA